MSQSAHWNEGRPIAHANDLGQRTLLTEWLIAGPFAVPAAGSIQTSETGWLDSVDEDFVGGERTIRPTESPDLANVGLPVGACTWQRLSVEEGRELPQALAVGGGVVYAVTYIDAVKEVDVAIIVADMPGLQPRSLPPVVQVMLDGVEITRRATPGVVRLAPGLHCLMLKIAGGERMQHSWRQAVSAGIVQQIGDGIGVSLVRPSGFWRGPADAPAMEVDAAIVNNGTEVLAACDLTAHLGDKRPGSPTRIDLAPGEVCNVRVGAPLGSARPENEATVTIGCAAGTLSTSVTIPRLPEHSTLHVVEGFHCDPVWISDQFRYNFVSLDNTRQMIDGCLADPGYQAFVHEIDYVKAFVDEYPDYRTAVFELVKEGRLNVGSSYSEPNENNCSGEALIRNILYGQCYHRHFLGGDPTVYHSWDVFGHTPQLSQILAKSGHTAACWSKFIFGLPPILNHMSPDGTQLPHVRTSYGWSSRGIDDLRTSTASLLAEKHSFGIRRHLVVDAHDFSTPSGWMAGRTTEMAESYPKIVMTSPEEFVAELIDDGVDLKVTSRNLTQYHPGTQNSRSEMKVANRLCENVLATAERWATFATLMGATYPDLPLDLAWRQVLFGQHHDALTGTPCDVSYLDLMAGYREALELGHESVRAATQFIADAVEVPTDGNAVVVFNPMNWERGGVIRLPKPAGTDNVEVRTADGQTLLSETCGDNVEVSVQTVPSVGYTTLTLSASDDAPDEPVMTTEGAFLQNEFWSITLDPERGGGISSLVDRKTGRELIDLSIGVGNDLGTLREDNARATASWEYWTLGERIFASDSRADVQIEITPMKQVATITGHLGTICTYRRTLTVRSGQRHIEADVVLDGYTQEDNMFVVATPVAISGAMPVFEDRFSSNVARRGYEKFDYRTNGPRRPSNCAIYPVYNWVESGWSARVDVGDGSSLNIGQADLVIPHDSEIEEKLEPLMKLFGSVGVTCTPLYDDDDETRLSELHRLHGEPGPSAAYDNTAQKRLDDLGLSALWMAISVAGNNAYAEDLLNHLPDAVRNRIKADETQQGWSLIVAEDDRLPEDWPSMPVIIVSAMSHEALTKAFTRIDEDLNRDSRIVLPDGCEFRKDPEPVDDYGFAYLTTGTGSASMEPDGTLTLILTHTSNWSAGFLEGSRFVPEHRTMAYQYALYPHDGSWRDGGVVRAGYEYLNPLTAAVPEGTGKDLPPSQSFVSLDADDAVITTIKPVGNPTARFESTPSDPRTGIVVRAYDASGKGTRGKLSLPSPISEAFAVTMMEEDIAPLGVADGSLDFALEQFSIETVRLVPGESDLHSVGAGDLGPTASVVQPVWSRYWRHNTGAHPMGYLPVAIYLDGRLPIRKVGGVLPTIGRVRAWIVNNQTDATLRGTARIIAPPHWNVMPSEIPYEIPPRGHVVQDVTVSFNTHERTGLLKARLEHAGQTYQDVMEVGRDSGTTAVSADTMWQGGTIVDKEREPDWHVVRDGDDIVVHVRNPWWEPLDVELVFIGPVETWGSIAGETGLCDVGPGHAGATVPGRQETTIRFKVSRLADSLPSYWAWMKLMCNGKADYKRV
jgi:alpha-mannosidase